MAGGCIQANQFGGDWWAVHDLNRDRVLVLIGDVTGHGIDAALMTGVIKGATEIQVANAVPLNLTATSLLESLNHAVFAAAPPGMTMSCVAAVIDQWDGMMTVANAGHPFPYVKRAKDGSLSHIVARGARLGAAPGTSYQATTVFLDEGDAVMWHTDGLLDNEDHAGRQFGQRRLRELLSSTEATGPAELREELFRELRRFCGRAEPVDDVAIVVATFVDRTGRHRRVARGTDIWGGR